MMAQLKSETQPEIARALEIRRAASVAGEVPGSWMLDSPGLSAVVETASQLAQVAGLPILIQGERGTGVGELARMIHTADPIARQQSLRIVPANQVGLLDTRGLSVEGTRFIEDIENLRPIGQEWVAEMMASRNKSSRPLRIIGGSRLSVSELLRYDGLNQELIHAMDVGRLVIPPLRTRVGDILPLATRFLRHYAEWQNRPELRFTEAAERKLLSHTYPANVRELRNIIDRAAALATSNEVGEGEIVVFDEAGQNTQLRADLFRSTASTDGHGGAHFPTLEEVERDYLTLLIREFNGQRTAIARTMGVSYPTVGRMITHFGIDVRAIVQAGTAPVEAAG